MTSSPACSPIARMQISRATEPLVTARPYLHPVQRGELLLELLDLAALIGAVALRCSTPPRHRRTSTTCRSQDVQQRCFVGLVPDRPAGQRAGYRLLAAQQRQRHHAQFLVTAARPDPSPTERGDAFANSHAMTRLSAPSLGFGASGKQLLPRSDRLDGVQHVLRHDVIAEACQALGPAPDGRLPPAARVAPAGSGHKLVRGRSASPGCRPARQPPGACRIRVRPRSSE